MLIHQRHHHNRNNHRNGNCRNNPANLTNANADGDDDANADNPTDLADLSNANAHDNPSVVMTNRVITLWYRPPELLLGSTHYGPEVDLWGVGCILWEMLTGRAPFTGTDELSQLEAIVAVLGPPPCHLHRHHYPWLGGIFEPAMKVSPSPSPSRTSSSSLVTVRDGDPQVNVMVNDLLERLLCYDPERRITAAEALQHPLLLVNNDRNDACDDDDHHPLLRLLREASDDWHEYDCKQRQRRRIGGQKA